MSDMVICKNGRYYRDDFGAQIPISPDEAVEMIKSGALLSVARNTISGDTLDEYTRIVELLRSDEARDIIARAICGRKVDSYLYNEEAEACAAAMIELIGRC